MYFLYGVNKLHLKMTVAKIPRISKEIAHKPDFLLFITQKFSHKRIDKLASNIPCVKEI